MRQSFPPPGEGSEIIVMGCDLDHKGFGIARSNDLVIQVPGLIPGERALVKLKNRRGDIWVSELVKVIEHSSARNEPFCQFFGKCGGCTLQHININEQQVIKQKRVYDCLIRIGKIKLAVINEIVAGNRSIAYRNRLLIPLKRAKSNTILLGYYAMGTHQIIDINSCPIHIELLNTVLSNIRTDIANTPWEIDSDDPSIKGLRYLGIRVGEFTNQVQILLVSNTPKLAGLNRLAKKWIRKMPFISGVTLNIKNNYSNTILGDINYLIEGSPYVEEIFYNMRFNLQASTFFQINTSVAEKAVREIVEWFLPLKLEKLIDCYCGIGTISLPLAQSGINVLGIDFNKDSISTARSNADKNSLLNTSFINSSVEEVLAKYLEFYEAIVIDPPRKGLNSKIISYICNSPPKYLVYMSCNPSTLARDLNLLCVTNDLYKIDRITPYDFFPHTTHIETLAFLVRKTNF